MGQKNKKVQTTPTLSEYLAQRAQQVRDSAANVYALKDMPEVPIIPKQNIFSKGLAWLGLSDDSRIKIAGKEETPLTCIYTTTSQYGDEGAKVPGNITFKNNPRKYGFEPIPMNIDSIGKGDLIQFAPSKKKDPIHAGMVTGTYKDEFNDRELPTLTYSRGGTGITTQTDEGNKPTMVHNRPWGEIVEKKDYRYPTAYRYIGSPQKQQEWTNEYNTKYGTQRSNGRLGVTARWAEGGFLQPRDAWDKLSIAEQAAMMKAAVSEGIFDLSEIRKRYNEFAEGGSKEKVVNTDEQYLRTMEKVAEDNYQKWGFSNPDEALLHALNDNTYNYRGYYGKYPQSKANADTHWTDEFKTVYHPTFSNESTYSGQKSQYNPLGLSGGFWSGDTFVPMAWQLDANEYKKGGRIHIKPENRGKFTALKERTGHSATWFKEHGTPAQKKMATFALNARHWKHGLGGNLFAPGGDITYSHPYYSYDENGQLIKDKNGKPILNYNATLPEIEIIGTNRNYPLKAKQERARQREIAKNYFASTPTLSNIYKGIEALVNSSPLVTTAATVNPNMVYGIAPTDAAFASNPLNSTTSNLLKWLGRPTNYRPKNPLSTAPFEKLSYEIKEGSLELKYPGLAKMMDLWERKGVDLSKIGIEDLDDIYRLRKVNYTKRAPSRYTIANQTGSNYELIDYDNGVPVGKIDLLVDDSENLFMSNIRNLTNKYSNGDPRKVHDVQRRGLNSAIAVAKSEGKEGIISGNYLQSAPKQYSAIFEHPERIVVSKKGLHTNENMVPPGEYGMFGGWEGPAEASSVEEMWANGDKKAMQLQNAPVWKLTEQSFFTPTKSDVFDPTIIDEVGKMHTDWNLLDIFKGLSIPIIGFNAIKNQKEKGK